MKKIIVATFVALALAGPATSTLAAPINCPPSQTAVKDADGGGWHCQNPACNANQSEDPKNPNR
jgi:hypothetical protein